MDTKVRRVHGNRLKPYSFPNTQWRSEQQRVTLDDLDDETKELFD